MAEGREVTRDELANASAVPADPADIPEPDLNIFLNTVTDAMDPARAGRAVEGFRRLQEGLNWTEAACEGQPWQSVLAELYQGAIARYTQQYGGRLVE